jgi:putative FmdB family regulatory protein
MPLYEYLCDACGHRFEKIQKFSDAIVETCPKCAGRVRKLQSAPAIQFKGSGFYITDYAKKDGPTATKTDAGPSDAKEKTDKTDKTGKTDQAGKAEKSEKPEKSEKAEKSEKSSSTESSPAPASSTTKGT